MWNAVFFCFVFTYKFVNKSVPFAGEIVVLVGCKMLSIILVVFCLHCVFSADVKSDDKFKNESNVEIVYLNIQTQIQARFATTLISSKVNNLGKDAKEVTFVAQLPESAFISNFSMFMDDRIIYGEVKEKEEAKVAFEAAKARGESAGHIAQKPRETNVFEISVNVAAHTKVSFNLTYQEILKRIHGVYKHVINLKPDQPVGQISVDINIVERGNITNVKIPKFGPKVGEKTNKELLLEEDEKNADIKTNISSNVSNVRVSYQPKSKDPKEIIDGQLVLLYDVKRDLSGGDIEVVDGYFVHFFAPEGLQKGNKHVVFVLDKSGSMQGRKFEQLKDAMKLILNDLNPEDIFNIIFFSSGLERWKPESVKATSENVKAAQLYVSDTEATGGTNIDDGLKDGLKILDSTSTKTLTSMLLFLTDGQPTVGETNGTIISENVTHLNSKKHIINSIGFGDDADILLMRKISANNKGLAKKVYEDSDATIQLTGFYDEISTTLLSEVKIDYLNETVDVNSIVQDEGHNYFNGGELVTFGKLQSHSAPDADVQASVSGKAKTGSVELKAVSSHWICPRWGWGCCPGSPRIGMDDRMGIMSRCCWGDMCPPIRPHPTTPRPEPLAANTLGGFVERMWAYQTIKKLLKQNELGDTKEGTVEKRKKQALELSLKYHFVTELTSMVVIKPNETTSSPLKESKDVKPEFNEHFGSLTAASSGLGRGGAGGGARPGLAGPMASADRSISHNGWNSFAPPPPPPPPPPPGKPNPKPVSGSSTEQQKADKAKEKKAEEPTTSAGETDENVPCHVNLLIVRHEGTGSNDWNQKFVTDLFDDVNSNKEINESRFFILSIANTSSGHETVTHSKNVTNIKANEKDDLAQLILKQFDQTNDKKAKNVVFFLAHSSPMKYATDAAPKLMKTGSRIYCVTADKVDEKKKAELLSIAGDYANLLVAPKAQHLSDRLTCKSLYVWRSIF